MSSIGGDPDPITAKSLLECCSLEERQRCFHNIISVILKGLLTLLLITQQVTQSKNASSGDSAGAHSRENETQSQTRESEDRGSIKDDVFLYMQELFTDICWVCWCYPGRRWSSCVTCIEISATNFQGSTEKRTTAWKQWTFLHNTNFSYHQDRVNNCCGHTLSTPVAGRGGTSWLTCIWSILTA